MNLFPNTTLVHILQLLILHPDTNFYQREIAELVSSGLLQAQRALQRIEKAGLILKNRRGNQVFYSANQRHPVFEELKRLFLKTSALGDHLREKLDKIKDDVRLIFLFGSVASGTEGATSDIDMLVVGQIGSRKLSSILGPLGREVDREINPVLYTEQEFSEKIKTRNHFVRQMLSGPKIWLIGSEDDLKKMVG